MKVKVFHLLFSGDLTLNYERFPKFPNSLLIKDE